MGLFRIDMHQERLNSSFIFHIQVFTLQDENIRNIQTSFIVKVDLLSDFHFFMEMFYIKVKEHQFLV